ncbi:YeaH/YhbH family protein [Haloparvum sp. PAK95]|uniref:YeaH/YhbH family protein n=1 Tax=Haloparvum sp. PAK95 TaxID=3418962 RepID=UPI003D2F0FA9
MGLKDDRRRFAEIGEERREDLADFITHGDLGRSRGDAVRIPIKIVDLPAFEYDRRDQGGVGQGDAEVGDPVEVPEAEPDDGDGNGDEDGDEPGDEPGEHEYYEMDPEEFAQELDEELGLDLEPKGKQVVEETEGDFTDVARTGPHSTLDVEHFFREGLKRKLAVDFDEEFVREALRVDGWGPDEVFTWARDRRIPVSKAWLREAAADVDEPDRWASIEAMTDAVDRTTTAERVREEGIDQLPLRREDQRFRHPEVVKEHEKNVVVVNIRDVSGSMNEEKRELVERVFTPLDWYLQGKYDNAEFVYVAHDADAWAVDREEFFGIRSGGGTKISSAYELAQELLAEYPWSEWNRFVFAAGDSENTASDTTEAVIPLMEAIDANLHAYVETQPGRSRRSATHAREVDDHFEDGDDVAVARVSEPDDVLDAIETILSTETEL